MAFIKPLSLRHSIKALAAAFSLGLCANSSLAADNKPLTAVADLRYGVALYNYYLNRNLEALSELMVAKEKGGIQGHGDNPEIMEGGFNLAYGMERRASEIFTRLLEDNRPLATRDAAWYYMARVRYQRGDYDSALEALEKVSAKPDSQLALDLRLLRINLAMRTGELKQASELMDSRRIRKSSDYPYLQFNLGAAYARQQDYDRSVEYFSELLELKSFSEGNLALYDKAMTAAGYARLLQKDYRGAMSMFDHVRLNSPIASRALLGYGWAAVELEDYSAALRPWQALAKRSLVDANTQESYVAVPYVYEKMGYAGLALESFREAEAAYTSELTRLDEVITQMQGHSIRDALNIDRSDDIDWLNYAKTNQVSPHLSYLVELFSKEAFLVSVQEIRDLLAIQENYAQWQQKLRLYREMLDERELNRGKEMDYIAQQALSEQIQNLTLARDELAQELARLQAKDDFLALVSPKQSASLERILRAEENLALLKKGIYEWGQQVMPREELRELEETVRIHKGLMTWQAQQSQERRLARVIKYLAELNAELEAIEGSHQRVQKIVSQGFDLAPYRERIGRAEDTLVIQSIDLEKMIQDAQNRLRDQVLAVLNQQKVRLNRYLAQSRLSIARLLDVKAKDIKEQTVPVQTEELGEELSQTDQTSDTAATDATTDVTSNQDTRDADSANNQQQQGGAEGE